MINRSASLGQESVSTPEHDQEAVIEEVARILINNLDISEVYEKFALAVKKLVPFARIFINMVD